MKIFTSPRLPRFSPLTTMSDNESVDLAPLTDDERASSVASTAASASHTLAPRYSFSYPTFEPKEKAPSFQPHPFWDALSSSAGRPLAKLSVVCRHPKFEIDEETANGVLNEALPAFVRSPLCLHFFSFTVSSPFPASRRL
jgi:hypothetical protein